MLTNIKTPTELKPIFVRDTRRSEEEKRRRKYLKKLRASRCRLMYKKRKLKKTKSKAYCFMEDLNT
jgi:hypothetical protein